MRASGNKFTPRLARAATGPALGMLGCLMCALASFQLGAAQGGDHRITDLYYGQALYQYFQENELAAITDLLVAREKPLRAGSQLDETNLLLADLLYSYGLYEESRGLFAQLLNAEVSDSVENRIWFNLARLRYEQGYYEQARDLLARINSRLPRRIEAERKYLLTNLYIGDNQYQQAAELSTAHRSGRVTPATTSALR
jgi:tetratricopeptide (TPR) repeat protein